MHVCMYSFVSETMSAAVRACQAYGMDSGFWTGAGLPRCKGSERLSLC